MEYENNTHVDGMSMEVDEEGFEYEDTDDIDLKDKDNEAWLIKVQNISFKKSYCYKPLNITFKHFSCQPTCLINGQMLRMIALNLLKFNFLLILGNNNIVRYF